MRLRRIKNLYNLPAIRQTVLCSSASKKYIIKMISAILFRDESQKVYFLIVYKEQSLFYPGCIYLITEFPLQE